MDEQHTDVLVQLEDIRNILADLRARCPVGHVQEQADSELPGSTNEGLEAVAAGLSRIETSLERRLTEEFSRDNHWFREMADFIPEGVLKLDGDGTVVYANDVLLQMFGLTRADLVAGLKMADFLALGEFERVQQTIALLAEGKAPQPSRYNACRIDGSALIIEALGSPTQDAAGRVMGFWGVIRDVTLEHLAEKRAVARTNLGVALGSVSDLEEAMRLVLDAAMCMEGVDSGCAYVAGPGAETFELVASRGLSDEFVRAVANRPTDLRHGLRAGSFPTDRGLIITREDILRSPDSSSRDEDLHSLAMVPMWNEGHPVAMVVVSSHIEDEIPLGTRDALEGMIDQVTSTIARIRAEGARREAVETFEAVFQTVPLALYIMDPEGRLVMWNAAATRTFGWSESEVLGRPLPFVQEEKKEESRRLIDQAFQGGGLHGVEVERRRRDGSAVFIRLSSAVLHASNGHPIGTLTTAEDVTEKRLAEQTQQRLNRLESLGVLAGGIAHDFNNVLMGIMGNVSLARTEANPELRSELLYEAQDATRRAVSLTAQLLTFAKGGAPLKEAVELATLLKEVLDFALNGSAVRLDLDLRVTSPVEVDPGQVREVIQSLVINALEAMPGGGALKVETGDLTDANGARFVWIAISDTGVGIGPETMEHIFDPYFTTKPAGTGLGLAVAHSIVAQHGGKITVHSLPDEGTTFQVFLPASAVVEEASRRQGIGAPTVEKAIKVLIVDDEDMVRTILVRMLERLGYSGVPCASGEEAIRLFREAAGSGEPFDVVITDLTMPGGLGGVETTAALLEIDPNVLVVVSSGYSDDPAIARFRDYGFVASVKKPYTLDALRETLESCCVRRPIQK
jgi:PAS domain S-box-containing protein